MIADMISNKKLNPIVTELFIKGRKLNISIAFITQSYFKVTKDVRLNSKHFFSMKIPNKKELQQIALNHSSDIDFKDFMKIYKNCTAEPYYFLVNDTTLPSDNPLRFRKNLLEKYIIKLKIRLEMENCNMILTERLQIYRFYHLAKLISMNILLVKKYCLLINNKIIEQAKFTYSPLEKTFEKQTKTIEDQGEKQVDALTIYLPTLPCGNM